MPLKLLGMNCVKLPCVMVCVCVCVFIIVGVAGVNAVLFLCFVVVRG